MSINLQHDLRSKTFSPRVLVVEDNEPDRALLDRMLKKHFGASIDVRTAETGAEALMLAERESFDVVFLDYRLPDMSGLDLLSRLSASGRTSAYIVLSGQGNEATAVEAMRRGAHDYLVKDQIQPELVERAVRQAVAAARQPVAMSVPRFRAEPAHADVEHLVRGLSHDMSANLLLLEHSFDRLKRSFAAGAAPAAIPSVSVADGVSHVEACLRQSKRFLADLVSLAKNGRVSMEPARVELSTVVDELLLELAAPLAERNVAVRVARELPAVWCHENRVKQVIGNLLQNALKHGCAEVAPRIEISTFQPGKSAGDSAVGLRIFDNGRGIATKYHQQAFEAGWRQPATRAPGTGMGLSIVKKIVEQYGGEISLEPNLPQGTAFRLSLPAAPAS
jgi:signal transduction histidine kinase